MTRRFKTAAVAVWVAALLFLALTLIFFPAGGHDDAYMTYWPAYALAHLSGIVNYSGRRTEQSSTLLLVLVLAGLSKLSAFHLPTLGRLCSLTFGLGGIFVTGRCADVTGPRRAAAVAPWFLATMAYFSFWSTSGMETPLVALLLLLAAIDIPRYLRSDKILRLPTLLIVILCVLVRPETAFVLGSVCLGLVVCLWLGRERPEAVRALALAALTLTAWGATVAFRLAYFGRPFPQPLNAKLGRPLFEEITSGLKYSIGSLSTHGVNGILPYLLPLACLAAVFAWRAVKGVLGWAPVIDIPALVLTLFVGADLAFVTLVGGDWMFGGRFLVPILPLLAVMGASVAVTLDKRTMVGTVMLVTAVQLVGFVALSSSPLTTSLPLWHSGARFPDSDTSRFDWFERTNWSNLRHMRALPYLEDVVGRARATTPRTLRVWVAQAGLVPYYLSIRQFGHLDILDLGGLTGRRLTACAYAIAHVPRGSGGFSIQALASIPRDVLERECQLEAPDFLYSLGSPDRFQEWRSDMVVVYRQWPRQLEGTNLLWSASFIAMRRDLYEAIGAPRTTDVTFEAVTFDPVAPVTVR